MSLTLACWREGIWIEHQKQKKFSLKRSLKKGFLWKEVLKKVIFLKLLTLASGRDHKRGHPALTLTNSCV